MERNPTVWRQIKKQFNPKFMNSLEGDLTFTRLGFSETFLWV